MKHTIYKITNKSNGKIYIGAHSTENPNDNYYGSGKLILRAIEKYGIKGFNKEILYIFDTKDEMFAKERELITQEFIERRDTYNLILGGDKPPIYQHTDESRARVSRQFKGITLPDEHKQKISATKKAGYHPYRGKKLTEEHKEKNRQAQVGRKHSDETKAKMSANMTGENNPNYGREFSEEYRKKLSEAQKGRIHSEETKRKMSKTAKGNQYAKGHKQTEEHKRKLAESRARTRRRKAKERLKAARKARGDK